MKKINLIFINIDKNLSEFFHLRLRKIKNLNFLLLLDVKKPRKIFPFECEYFNPESLHFGDYEYNKFSYSPIDESIISKMNEHNHMLMKMLDRGLKPLKMVEYQRKINSIFSYEKKTPYFEMNYDIRRSIIQKHLKFWNHKINKKKINFFFSVTTPHIVYDYIPYLICKFKKIKTLVNLPYNYEGRLISSEAIESDFKKIQDNFIKNKKKINKSYKFSKQINDYIFQLTKKKSPVWFSQNIDTQFYSKVYKNNFVFILSILKSFFKFDFKLLNYKKTIKVFEDKFFEKYSFLSCLIDKYAKKKLPEKKFIYFPLHFEPEASTAPLGGKKYFDQSYVIDLLSFYCKKYKYVLVVKEHPFQKSISREVDFYWRLIEDENIWFINKNFNGFEIIDKCDGVATITGTTGWEALANAKPVLCFGDTHLKVAPYVTSPKKNEDIEIFFKNIENNKCSIFELKIFLKSLEEISHKGYFNWCVSDVSKFNTTENKNATSIFENFLKNLK